MESSLPAELQQYLNNQADAFTGEDAYYGILTILIFLLFQTLIYIGLWNFKKWARTATIAITIIFLPIYPFIGPTVLNPWENLFYDLSLMIDGIIIAMMFSTQLNEEFKNKKLG